jgi:hypothetical protein
LNRSPGFAKRDTADPQWIAAGIRTALEVVREAALDVRIVSFGTSSHELIDIVTEWKAARQA